MAGLNPPAMVGAWLRSATLELHRHALPRVLAAKHAAAAVPACEVIDYDTSTIDQATSFELTNLSPKGVTFALPEMCILPFPRSLSSLLRHCWQRNNHKPTSVLYCY